ncbi:hypothetical protein [Nocardia wallacei]|uniref:hypothetical protein n=1 Tax=Nocardia wallacei TaxID=480035 RepID=UPI0024563334|nr:hypothetical protein [Nocardia wallacei]
MSEAVPMWRGRTCRRRITSGRTGRTGPQDRCGQASVTLLGALLTPGSSPVRCDVERSAVADYGHRADIETCSVEVYFAAAGKWCRSGAMGGA